MYNGEMLMARIAGLLGLLQNAFAGIDTKNITLMTSLIGRLFVGHQSALAKCLLIYQFVRFSNEMMNFISWLLGFEMSL